MDVESEFWTLVQTANALDADARRILNDDDAEPVDSNRMVEPAYLAICKLVADYPKEREVFVRCFSTLVLWERDAPFMLVPFCMRVLKFPEVSAVLSREMEKHRGTARYAHLMNYGSAMSKAYSDEVWENAIAFDTFSHELADDG